MRVCSFSSKLSRLKFQVYDRTINRAVECPTYPTVALDGLLVGGESTILFRLSKRQNVRTSAVSFSQTLGMQS